MIDWFYSLSRFFTIFFFKFYFRFQAIGTEYIPKSGAFLLACNHTSLLDPLFLGAASSRRLNYMAKEELFNNFLLSFCLRKLGVFPVKRNSHDVGAVREALRRLKAGKPLLVFPEGQRSRNGDISEVQPGIAMLALHASVPVLPAFIKGSKEALARGSRFVRPKKVKVYFGKPFYINKTQSYHEIAKYIRMKIISLSGERIK
jgi:1-acyl-sn-glycerol-3-phosphate acyltransferase